MPFSSLRRLNLDLKDTLTSNRFLKLHGSQPASFKNHRIKLSVTEWLQLENESKKPSLLHGAILKHSDNKSVR